MRLESISLHGFKSFAEKSVLKVMPGITAIVGPNGCGKSNISESVRWALGEQSAKSLRGQRMEDLIFHGSASRKPIGFAEVELTFSNDGVLSVPWTEVAVSRRLYRTGESEYLLNKNPSRLRDILDLFAGTGANPRAYSVMDQDKLNHVLTAKPHERRVFIEEAAGIARYKQQRNETEGKLDATRQNLVRVRDVMDEVRRQLNSLERQAKKAQQYKILQSEKRDLGLALVAADFAGLTGEGERLTGELVRLRDGEEVLAHAPRRARGPRGSGAGSAPGERAPAVRSAPGGLEGAGRARAAPRAPRADGRADPRARRREPCDSTRRSGRPPSARPRIVGERENVRLALRDAEQVAAERSRAATEFEAALERHRAALALERDHAEALRLEQTRLAAERVDLMRSAGELREREIQLARRAERLAAELARGARPRPRGSPASAGPCRRRAIGRPPSWSRWKSERQQLAAQEAAAERRLTEAEAQLADARVALAARRSSFEALSELERAREGYGAGVRAVFADGRRDGAARHRRHRRRSARGPVRARARRRGGARRAPAVGGRRALRARARRRRLPARARARLRDLPAARAPAGAVGPRSGRQRSAQWVARRVGATAAAASCITSSARSRSSSTSTRRSGSGGATAWSRPTSRRAGRCSARPAGSTAAARGAAIETRAFAPGPQAAAARARGRGRAALGGRRRRARPRSTTLGAQFAALREQIAELARSRCSVPRRAPRRRQGSRADGAGARAGAAPRRDGRGGVAPGRARGRRDERHAGRGSAQRIAVARDAEGALEAAVARVRDAIESAQSDETALGAELTACRVDLASVTERVEALGRELVRARRDRARSDRASGAGGAAAQRSSWSGGRGSPKSASAPTSRRARSRSSATGSTPRRAARPSTTRGWPPSCARSSTRRGAARASSGGWSPPTHEIEIRATECRVRREELGQEAWRVYGVDAQALLARHDPARDLTTVRARVAELEERLVAIGAVNLVADDEYRELDERLTFLRTQHDDLTGVDQGPREGAARA